MSLIQSALAEENLSLQDFIREAKLQNLSLKAKGAEAEAEKSASFGIRIPAPQASFIRMNMDAGSGSGFAINQTIPFPTKVVSEHNVRKAMFSVQKEELNATHAEIIALAKFIYFRLWEAAERLRLLKEKSQIIEHHIKLARAASRSDSFLKIHVIKAENDLDLLKNSILEAEQNLRERQIEAAEFLNRNPNEFRPTASEFPPSSIPTQESMTRSYPLEVKRFDLEVLKSKESEAHSTWFPDLMFQYKDMGNTPMLAAYKEFMVGASVPLAFFWQPSAEGAAASARRRAAEFRLDMEKRRIESVKTTFTERATSLKKQLDQFMNELLPRAERRMKIVNNLAPRDIETLQDQRETLEAFPDLQLKALEVREEYEQAVMELEKLSSGEDE